MIERVVVEAAAALRASSEPYLVATVVAVTGSSYRRPGARLLIAGDRRVVGSISGGCLEADLLRKAWWHTRHGPVVVTYDTTSDEEDGPLRYRLGCNGVVDILLERSGAPDRIDPLALAERCLHGHTRAAVAVVRRSGATGPPVGTRIAVSADGVAADPLAGALRERIAGAAAAVLASGASAQHRDDDVDLLIEAYVPPPRLLIFGAGEDAVPLAQLARLIGWQVVVCAPRPRMDVRARMAAADELRFGPPEVHAAGVAASDRAAAVVMNHDYELDRACLAMLLGSDAAYVGVLGPRRRTERMLAELGVAADARLHAPVGLRLGAETPQQIALAVVAEIQAALARAPAASLRHRTGASHGLTAAVPG